MAFVSSESFERIVDVWIFFLYALISPANINIYPNSKLKSHNVYRIPLKVACVHCVYLHTDLWKTLCIYDCLLLNKRSIYHSEQVTILMTEC